MNFLINTQKSLDVAPVFGTQVNALSAIKRLDKSAIKKTDVWKLDIHKIVFDTSYDVRLSANPHYYTQEHVINTLNGITNDILSGQQLDAISISFIGGNPTVVGGFKLYRAAMDAAKISGDTLMVPVIDVGSTPKAVMLSNLKRNRSDNYTQLELGALYKSLMVEGMSEREITAAFNVSKNHIKAAVETLSLPHEVKKLISARQISPAQWDNMVTEYGQTNALSLASEVSQSQGKVTKKTVEKVTATEPQEAAPPRKSKSGIYKSMQTVLGTLITNVKSGDLDTNGNTIVSLTPEQSKMLLDLENDISD